MMKSTRVLVLGLLLSGSIAESAGPEVNGVGNDTRAISRELSPRRSRHNATTSLFRLMGRGPGRAALAPSQSAANLRTVERLLFCQRCASTPNVPWARRSDSTLALTCARNLRHGIVALWVYRDSRRCADGLGGRT